MPSSKTEIDSFEVPQASADALRAVDLRLYFGNHGDQTLLPEHRLAVLALEDRIYADITSFAGQLDAGRGDVLAQEGIGYKDEWEAGDMFSALGADLGDSPYLLPEDHSVLRNNLFTKDPYYATGPAGNMAELMRVTEKLRRFRLINTFDYAAALAVSNGVTCRYADANAQELNEWWKAKDEQLERRVERLHVPKFLYPAIGMLTGYADIPFRDQRTVVRLGGIATAMRQRGNERPVLGVLRGGDHRSNVETILRNNDIPFTSNEPDLTTKARHRRDTIRDVAHLGLRFIESAEQRYARLWAANAESVRA